MFGKSRRVNAIPDSGYVDGSTDPSSSAYSPLVTEDNTKLTQIHQQSFQPDNVRVQSSSTTGAWDHEFRGVAKYVAQDVGGQSGNANTLGYSTGLRPRKESRTPLTGRILVVPNMGVHPVIGAVGRDNRANKLFAGVASQNSDYQPMTTAEIAAQFTGRGVQLEGQ